MNNEPLHITTRSSCLIVHHYHYGGKPYTEINIDVDNFCADNNYNGDHAGIDLTLTQVKELHDYLTCVLNANLPNPTQPKEFNNGKIY